QAEDGIRDRNVTGVQTCALPIYSLLPIIDAFTDAAGVKVETRDISLAGRILAQFADVLEDNQQVADDLAELGQLALEPGANIIKIGRASCRERVKNAAGEGRVEE